MEDKELQAWSELDCDSMDIDELERKLESELEEQMADLDNLELDRAKIGSPDALGDVVLNVVWEQFINQVGVVAGEDFIKANRGLTLDLRDSAHIQTTENFAKGKISAHNTEIDYQKRYDDWQSNFEHDEKGNVVTHSTRSGKQEATLTKGAREPYDKGRPSGSKERGTDVDHIISAAEIIRDPAANAHMTQEERIAFANCEHNLHEMDARQNQSKGDMSMSEWLDNANKKGQKPCEIFDISEAQDKTYREKDAGARAELAKRQEKAEQRSIQAGKRSQRAEAMRIGSHALRAAIMGMLTSLVKDIIQKLIAWLRQGNRKLKAFIASIKEAIRSFVSNLKTHLKNAGDSFLTSIFTAIIGPVVGVIKKAWILLKQGFNSVRQAIKFLKDPANRHKPFGLKMLEVGKIVIAGLTAGGAIVLSEVIEKGLMSVPAFAIQIPMLGSLASIMGMFFGALVSGLIGALALNLIDRLLARKLEKQNELQQVGKKNEILTTQEQILTVANARTTQKKERAATDILGRHMEANRACVDMANSIRENDIKCEEIRARISDMNEDIDNLLNNL